MSVKRKKTADTVARRKVATQRLDGRERALAFGD
jgi:hypothetical protein